MPIRITMRAAAGVALVVVVFFAASPGHSFDLGKMLGGADQEDISTFKLIHVADLKAMLDVGASEGTHVYDANGPETREKYGVIPGAILLTSDNDYDLSILPANKTSKLVFYCANTHCMASHEAARRAVKAGYKDVNVMVDGIAGWKAAGEPTAHTSGSDGRNS